MMRRAARAGFLVGALCLASCSSGGSIQPGTTKLELSPLCNAALNPIREYMADHTEPIDADAKMYLRSKANEAYRDCSVVEFRYFADTELNPWAERVGSAETAP